MRVAVTGASGQIGSEVVRQLRAAGHETLSLDQKPPSDSTLPHTVIDLRVGSAVRAAFERMDAVFHIGEIPNVYNRSPSEVLTHNVEVGSTVIASAAATGVRKLIYTSSCQVYGCWGEESAPLVSPKELPLVETASLRPQNAYALSKLCNEIFAEQTARQKGMTVAAYRFPWVLQPWVLEKHARRPRTHWPLRADGLSTYVGLEDAAAAYLCGLESSWEGFEAFHFTADDVAGDEPVRPGMLKFFPDAPLPEFWPDHASPVNTHKAQTLLGWKPRFKLLDAVARLRETILQPG